jgi:hypothetical protein
LGSARAGAKAGAITGLYFSGAAVALNAVVLLAFKSQVLSALGTGSSTCSQIGPASQAGTELFCYSSLFTSALPTFFVGLLAISFIASVFFGVYFEFVPGRSYLRKALLVSLVMLVVMLNFVLPIAGDGQQELLMITFEVVLAVGYAVISSRLYRRFTREVEFQSTDPSKLKVMLGKRDQTGKKRTYSIGSTQEVTASPEGRQFRVWLVSGGVTVGDPRNPTTTIKVLGDGLLKAN